MKKEKRESIIELIDLGDLVGDEERLMANNEQMLKKLKYRGFQVEYDENDLFGLMEIDLANKGTSSKDAEMLLLKVGILVTQTQKGIAISLRTVTARGMGTAEMSKIAAMIDLVLRGEDLSKISDFIKTFMIKFPPIS